MNLFYRRDLELAAPRWTDCAIRNFLPNKNPFTINIRKKGVIFVHIPKNAGRSIYLAVLREPGRHIPLRRYST